MIYPDSTSGTDRVKHHYNRQGEVIETTDQNQTERAFDYDLLVRRTQDRVVTLGSGVDGAVRRIETAYNKRGDVERITSFDSATAGSGNVVNEVFVLYNGFGQAIDTFQSHTGAVNLSTTPSVQMSYADGSANTIRPIGGTYPDGRQVTVNSGHTSVTSPQFGWCWTLDPTGNWHGFRQDDDGNSTWDLIQARASNPVNEITDFENTTGSSWVTPVYDRSGNQDSMPCTDLGVLWVSVNPISEDTRPD